MKVCHFTVAHNATDRRIFEKECKSLLKNGYNVSIVAPNEEDRIQDGIKIIGVKINYNPLNRLFFGAKKIYKKALELDADIYHFHDVELFSYGLKLKKMGKKVVFDSHEDWIEYAKEIKWLPSILKNISSKLIEYRYKKNLNKFDFVITVSPHIVENLCKYTTKDKVKLVTNYPLIDIDNIEESSFIDYNNKKCRLCYAGTAYEISNQESIIRAIFDIDNISYTIVGFLSDTYKAVLSKLGGWNKVKFINKVPKDKLLKIYNESSIGIVVFDYTPNCGGRKGTMGNNKIFEYMLAGLPIICTDFDSWKNLIVDKYKCGICVRPRNIEDIRKAIIYLIENKDKAYDMGMNGRKAVIEEFNWATQEEKLIKIYKNL